MKHRIPFFPALSKFLAAFSFTSSLALVLAFLTLIPPGCATAPQKTSAGPHSGRFNLGVGNTALLHGYPASLSTSYFIVQVGSKFASNSERLKRRIPFLSGTIRRKSLDGVPIAEISYDFEGIHIIQQLIPVDKDNKPVRKASRTRFFRVAYTLDNHNGQTKRVGLKILTDTIIRNEDAPLLYVNNRVVRRERAFYGGDVPDRIFIRPGKASSSHHLSGVIHTSSTNSSKPEALYIGRWSYLSSVTDKVTLGGKQFRDNAILLAWNPRALAPEKKRKISIRCGTEKAPLAPLTARVSNPGRVFSLDLGYALNQHKLTEAQKFKIRYYMMTMFYEKKIFVEDISFVLVEGYTDASGSHAKNEKLSTRRAETVREYLGILGINRDVIFPKHFGEYHADQTRYSRQSGNRQDRSVIIRFFIPNGHISTEKGISK